MGRSELGINLFFSIVGLVGLYLYSYIVSIQFPPENARNISPLLLRLLVMNLMFFFSFLIEGCPAIQKRRFLTTLIDAMTQDMVEWAKNNSDSR